MKGYSNGQSGQLLEPNLEDVIPTQGGPQQSREQARKPLGSVATRKSLEMALARSQDRTEIQTNSIPMGSFEQNSTGILILISSLVNLDRPVGGNVCNQDLYDFGELYARGGLHGIELSAFREHLSHCEECRKAVAMELLLFGKRPIQSDTASLPVDFEGVSVLVQLKLSKTVIQNIGILLLDTHLNRLYSRFRRDWEEFTGSRAKWFKLLPAAVCKQARQLGGEGCLKWLSAFTTALRISRRSKLFYEPDVSAVLHRLYREHIRPAVLPFQTHLPQYSLEAAAGKFGKQMEVEPEGWVEVLTPVQLRDDMYVTHVKGHSMEPQIPDVSLCAFRSKIIGSLEGRVLLLEQYGELGGNRYTVKRCHLAHHRADSEEKIDPRWLHERMTLESTNPEFEPMLIAPDQKIRVLGEFLLVV
jgi:hypothetical protein